MAHIWCRAISAATSRTLHTHVGGLRVRMHVGSRTARHWRQIRLSIALSDHVHVLISEESTGTSVRHPPRRRTLTGARRSSTNQQRCLTPCSLCASWDSSPSPPPVTSRTAPEEGNERCRRLGSDRWGPMSFLPSFEKSSFIFELNIFLSCLWGCSHNISKVIIYVISV